MHLFYCPDISGNSAILSADESAHCIRVLRLRNGDQVQLLDGRGGWFEAVITVPDPKECSLGIISHTQTVPQRNFNLHIAIAPTKSIDRFEWFIEKAVEIGIDTITPLLCQRSERRVLKTDRLHKLIISTMKQAMVTQLPLLNELTGFEPFINGCTGLQENLFIAHCIDPEYKLLNSTLVPAKDVTVLIGPEAISRPWRLNLQPVKVLFQFPWVITG